jgi:tetratricopeptide (TPR) repeat protein
MVITLPFLLILCDYYFYRSFNKKYLLNKIPFFIISFIFVIITIISQHKGGAINTFQITSIYNNILIALKGIVFYLEKTILPINLSAFYPYPQTVSITSPSFSLPLIILSVIIFLVYFSRKFTKEIIFGSFFFIITILPVLKLISFGDVPVADRYMYIPSIGLFFMAGIAFKWIYYKKVRLDKLKKISIVLILFMVVVSYSILTIRRNSVWKDGESLWLDVLKKYPEVTQAHNNLGVVYDKKKGMTDEAIYEYKKALKINPNYVDSHYNLGLAYYKKGMTDEAISEYKKAIEIDPDFEEAYGNLGIAYGKKGMLDKEITLYKKVIEINPNDVLAHYRLSLAYSKKGMKDMAISGYKKAISINPNYAEAYYGIGFSYWKSGRYFLSAEYYYKAGLLFLEQGNIEWALKAYESLKFTKSEELQKALFKKLYPEIKHK